MILSLGPIDSSWEALCPFTGCMDRSVRKLATKPCDYLLIACGCVVGLVEKSNGSFWWISEFIAG